MTRDELKNAQKLVRKSTEELEALTESLRAFRLKWGKYQGVEADVPEELLRSWDAAGTRFIEEIRRFEP